MNQKPQHEINYQAMRRIRNVKLEKDLRLLLYFRAFGATDDERIDQIDKSPMDERTMMSLKSKGKAKEIERNAKYTKIATKCAAIKRRTYIYALPE